MKQATWNFESGKNR